MGYYFTFDFYEKIPFKIVCEEYLEEDIVDYKFYFADGKFICTQVISGRYSENKTFAYYDDNWQLLDINRYNMKKCMYILEEAYVQQTESNQKFLYNCTYRSR